jgi:hypothetical protein
MTPAFAIVLRDFAIQGLLVAVIVAITLALSALNGMARQSAEPLDLCAASREMPPRLRGALTPGDRTP